MYAHRIPTRVVDNDGLAESGGGDRDQGRDQTRFRWRAKSPSLRKRLVGRAFARRGRGVSSPAGGVASSPFRESRARAVKLIMKKATSRSREAGRARGTDGIGWRVRRVESGLLF